MRWNGRVEAEWFKDSHCFPSTEIETESSLVLELSSFHPLKYSSCSMDF